MNKIIVGKNPRSNKSRMFKVIGASSLSLSVLIGLASVTGGAPAFAAESSIDLGASKVYSVLGGQTVTNTGNSVIQDNLGVSPGTSVTGFPPGLVFGEIHTADAQASLAQSDLVKAYDDAASRAPTKIVEGDLVGQTLVGGVYKSDSSLELNGTVTLDGEGNPDSVWIFQVGSTLTTGSSSKVELINGASACNVYWQVGSSATLGTSSDFKGSILALTSISATNDATVEGRALARNGAVTLDNNLFITPNCEAASPEPTAEPTVIPTAEPTVAPTVTPTELPTIEPTEAPSTSPTLEPSLEPTPSSTIQQTENPIPEPSVEPSIAPSEEPTNIPSQEPIPTEVPIETEPVTTPPLQPPNSPTEDATSTPTESIPLLPIAPQEPTSPTESSPFSSKTPLPSSTITPSKSTEAAIPSETPSSTSSKKNSESTELTKSPKIQEVSKKDDLATTGPESTILLTSAGVLLALIGAVFLRMGSTVKRARHRS